MMDRAKVDAFCIFQSFFMGYYYHVFGSLVDTSTLVCRTVEGSWGFRSGGVLKSISQLRNMNTPLHHMKLGREAVLSILAGLFLGDQVQSGWTNASLLSPGPLPSDCMGIVEKRALLINTLLGKCSSPKETGGFTLLDVDVGGVPRDHNGLVRAGQETHTQLLRVLDTWELAERTRSNVRERGPDVDVTFNIEADWEGNPDTALVCARYKGRRVMSLSPVEADRRFCLNFVPPKPQELALPPQRPCLAQAVEVDLEMMMQEDAVLPCSPDRDVPVLVQALGRPRLRYCAAALYRHPSCDCKISTDSVQGASEGAASDGGSRKSLTIIAGTTDGFQDVPFKSVYAEYESPMYEITGTQEIA
ncbi:hypothetical protein ACJ41O_000231 [Fusarium nematophilum]